MPAAILGPIAGSVVGGLLSDGGGEEQTATKEPWSAAAPWLRENLRTGQGLQGYYQQNPFNQQQQASYQNTFGDIDAFRNQMAPGLMGFANKLMGSSYQRGGSTAGANGAVGGGGMGGLLSSGQAAQGGDIKALLAQLIGEQGGTSRGGMPMQQGIFRVPQGQSYGQIDWNAQNPFRNGAIEATSTPTADSQTVEEMVAAEIERQRIEQQNNSNRFA